MPKIKISYTQADVEDVIKSHLASKFDINLSLHNVELLWDQRDIVLELTSKVAQLVVNPFEDE